MSVEIRIADKLVPYPEALNEMLNRVEAIINQQDDELVWLLEHPPLYTAGSSAKSQDLLMSNELPVYETGRGGQYTYHGPGQRVIYLLLDLKKRMGDKPDIRKFVYLLENWIIRSLRRFAVEAVRRDGRVGIWIVHNDGREEKIAAIGIRVRKWVSYHGVSVNLSPNLEHYSGIVPCGISEYGVTSLHALGVAVTMSELDYVLQQEFNKIKWQ